MKFQGYVFDMDGTMVDNGRYHILAWQEFAKRHGKSVSAQDVLDWMGMTAEIYNERIFGRRFTAAEQAALCEEKEAIYREIYRPHLCPPPGLPEFLEDIRKSGGKCAVATGGPRENVDFVLDGLGLRPYFPVVVSADMYRKSKPDPECFVMAASLLGADPRNCVVFEDGFPGIAAGKAAGMKVVAVPFTHPRERLLAAGADCVIADYRREELAAADVV